jgi:hypothetical protein
VEFEIHAGGAEGGVAVIEEQSAGEFMVWIGELLEQEGGSGGGVHPGIVAEQAEQFEAQGLAGLFLAGVDIEGGGKGGGRKGMGVEGPEGEEVELFGGAGEVLAVEIYDLGD